MQHFIYIGTLIFSFCGIAFFDLNNTRVMHSFKKGLLPILITFLILIIADIIGISLNIFHTNPHFVSGLFIGTKDLPVEEIFLLLFLPYFSLILSKLVNKKS